MGKKDIQVLNKDVSLFNNIHQLKSLILTLFLSLSLSSSLLSFSSSFLSCILWATGNVNVTVTYALNDLNQLLIEFTAQTDQATPISLTNVRGI